MRTPIVLLFALLTGCAGLSPSKIEPPAAVLLSPPAKIPDVKAGDDLVQNHLHLRRQYVTLASRHKRLQKWADTVLGK
jgi:hypothetical protein